MRYLTLSEIIELHRLITETSGGATGIRDLGALESAIAQPKATFDMIDLYPSLADKAAALCLSIVQNHPFVDGNKRTGHAAMSTFLLLNGAEANATIDEQEQLMLDLAAGRIGRDQLAVWLNDHIKPIDPTLAG
jgi:death-on-curing protein